MPLDLFVSALDRATLNWLTLELRKQGLPIVCLDARHAKAASACKSIRPMHMHAWTCPGGADRLVPRGRHQEHGCADTAYAADGACSLVSQRQAIGNNIRGLLKTFGVVIARGSNGPFASRVREAIADNATLAVILEPLLLAWQALLEQVANFDRQVILRAKTDIAARRLMTIPGSAWSRHCLYRRYRRSRWFQTGDSVVLPGADPRRYQSGEIDKAGSISKCGDGSTLLPVPGGKCFAEPRCPIVRLKAWGVALASGIGMRRAKVAVARKLSVIMHRVWRDERDFDWGDAPAGA